MSSKYPKSAKEIPIIEHWAIVEDVNVFLADEDCSRTYFNYLVFMMREEWEEAIRSRMADMSYGRKSFRAMHVIPARIEIQTIINIG